MTTRTTTTKNGDEWQWEETPEVAEALKALHKGKFAATIPAPFTHHTRTLPMPKTKTDTQGVKHLQWVTKPEDAAVIDEAFWIKRQRWGTFVSVGADDIEVITALTEEECITATRWYLKAKQEGFTDDVRTYDSVVGGKL